MSENYREAHIKQGRAHPVSVAGAVMLHGKLGFIYDYCRKIISIDGNDGARGGPLQRRDGWPDTARPAVIVY